MRQGTTVHLIDDDAAILDSLGLYLESKGFTVHRYGSASAAAAIEVGAADSCIVTDVRMPGMSGLQLADMIRARDPDLPIVLMTGFADLPPDEVGIGGSGLPRLSKPFWQADLESVVASVCRQRALRSPGRFTRRGD